VCADIQYGSTLAFVKAQSFVDLLFSFHCNILYCIYNMGP